MENSHSKSFVCKVLRETLLKFGGLTSRFLFFDFVKLLFNFRTFYHRCYCTIFLINLTVMS